MQRALSAIFACGFLLLPMAAPAADAATVAKPVAETSAIEVLFVRALPAIPLMSTPGTGATAVRELTPGDRLIVLGREAGFVHVETADGVQGWMQETALTSAVPAAARVAELEKEVTQLRADLSTAQGTLRTTQSQLRQARQAATATRESGADRSAALESENRMLTETLDAANARVEQLQAQVAQVRMAQESAQLLAAQQPPATLLDDSRFSRTELAVIGAGALGLGLLGVWFGTSRTRRRLRRRYHGMEL